MNCTASINETDESIVPVNATSSDVSPFLNSFTENISIFELGGELTDYQNLKVDFNETQVRLANFIKGNGKEPWKITLAKMYKKP
jgi:hypothetical protein